MANEENQVRVDHPGLYEPEVKDIPKDHKGSVTKAGSHTVYFLNRKPTDTQAEKALEGGEA